MPMDPDAPEEPLVDRIQAAYDRRLEQVGGWLAGAEAFTREKPWAALGASLVTGWLLAGLTGTRRTVYVRKTARDGGRDKGRKNRRR